MKQIVFGVHEAGNVHGIRFYKVELMCAKWAVCSVFGTVINSPSWLEIYPKRPCVWCLKLMK